MTTPRFRLLARSFTPAVLAAFTSLAGATVACGGGGDDDDGAAEGDGGSGGSGDSGGSGGSGGSGDSGGSSAGGSSAGGSGGSGGGTAPGLDDLDPAGEAEWTIFVYGHGDHNLSNSLLKDLTEMTRADLGEPGEVNVLILTDWDASQTIANTGDPFPEGIQLFRIPGGGAEFEVVAEGPERNLDDPAILTSVVRDVFENFPARRRGVVLWNHGGAWSGGFGSDTENGTVERPTPMP